MSVYDAVFCVVWFAVGYIYYLWMVKKHTTTGILWWHYLTSVICGVYGPTLVAVDLFIIVMDKFTKE